MENASLSTLIVEYLGGVYFCFRKKIENEGNMKQYALLFACLFFLCVGSKAQEQPTRWTLRACLDYALEHNIQVKKSKVSHLYEAGESTAFPFPFGFGYPRIRELSFERRRYK